MLWCEVKREEGVKRWKSEGEGFEEGGGKKK